jgi:hypothetical protein
MQLGRKLASSREKQEIEKRIEIIRNHNIGGDKGHAPLFCSKETAPGEGNPIQVIGLE